MFHYLVVAAAIFLTCNFCSPKIKDCNETGMNDSKVKKENLKKIIHGGWILKQNLDTFNVTNNIVKSFPQGQYFPELIIDTSEATADTIPNYGCLMNGKEGHYFKIAFENTDSDFPQMHLIFNHNYTGENIYINYKINDKDTFLILLDKNLSNNKNIVENDYVKIYTTPPNRDYNINPTDYFINQKILTGEYQVVGPEKNENNKVIFQSNGKVSGLENYHSYFIGHSYQSYLKQTTFLNHIIFYTSDTTHDYAYNRNENTILLYDIILDNKSGKRRKGNLKYQLEPYNNK